MPHCHLSQYCSIFLSGLSLYVVTSGSRLGSESGISLRYAFTLLSRFFFPFSARFHPTRLYHSEHTQTFRGRLFHT